MNFNTNDLKNVIKKIIGPGNKTEWSVNAGNDTGFHTRVKQLRLGTKRPRITMVYMSHDVHVQPNEPDEPSFWNQVLKDSQEENAKTYLEAIPSFVTRAGKNQLNEVDWWIADQRRSFPSLQVPSKSVPLPSQVSSSDSSPDHSDVATVLDSPTSEATLPNHNDQDTAEETRSVEGLGVQSQREDSTRPRSVSDAAINELSSRCCEGIPITAQSNKDQFTRFKYLLSNHKREEAQSIESLSDAEIVKYVANASIGDDTATFLVDRKCECSKKKWTMHLADGSVVFRTKNAPEMQGHTRQPVAKRVRMCKSTSKRL